MRYNVDLLESLDKLSDNVLDDTFRNRLDQATINLIKRLRNQFIEIISKVTYDVEYPEWFISSIVTETDYFTNLIRTGINRAGELKEIDFSRNVKEIELALNFGVKNAFNSDNTFISLPTLLNFISIQNLTREITTPVELLKQFETESEKLKTRITESIDQRTKELLDLEDQLKISLALVNKQVGKVGVKDYAKIFYEQALEHSLFLCTKNPDYTLDGSEEKYIWGFGKAQIWISFAMLSFMCFICVITQIDKIFKIGNALNYTPEITIHIIGRVLLISLIIFVISFAFKQYRVNMHLYTLNKHRANTLKSFEYLTRAPDKLEPQSYNAILMEVAKAIYEAGQTGYISASDNNSDIPSIIDMSKVITQPKS